MPISELPRVPEPSSLQPGDLLEGKWEIEGPLGEGGMGRVYLARDVTLERKVAIKILAESFADDPAAQDRLGREARLMARLDHPSIVPIYGVGMRAGHPFIVMKRLEGQSLRDVLEEEGGPLPPPRALRIVEQLGSALDHIHASGLIHRDIKPSNVLVRADGAVTLLDFGITRDTAAVTQTLERAGSTHYMAPEQLENTPFDHRVDLYALGLVLFELLTGRRPYAGGSEASLAYQHVHAPIPRVEGLPPELGPAVSRVVARALAKKPEERFGSGAELSAAFAAALVPGAERRKLSRWGLAVGGGVLGVLLALGVAIASRQTAAPAPLPLPLVTAPAPPPQREQPAAVLPTPVEVKPAPESARRGEVSVVTSFHGEPVWASVYVDGVYAGGTPVSLRLQPGRHTVRIARKGYKTMVRSLHVKPGQVSAMRLELGT